jgi:hypothetical protein
MVDKKTLLVSGASIAAGSGLSAESNDTRLWVNQVATEFNFDVTNIAKIGDDNKEIFLNTMLALTLKQYDYAIVQWAPIPNINLNLGLELYSNRFNLIGTRDFGDINLVSNQQIDLKYLNKARRYQMKFYKEHWEIRELLAYCKFIKDKIDTKCVYFLNYSMPWDCNRFFDKTPWSVPSDLDKFTQDLLDVDLRSDVEIEKLYNMIHLDYSTWGPVDKTNWVNLYEPLQMLQVDQISAADHHPGYLSQDRFSKFLIDFFKKII